jgi:hypothetical protein
VKVCAKFSLIVVSFIAYAAAQQATPPISQTMAHPKFVCNTGYSLQRCHEQVAVLSAVLDKYRAYQPERWTWVLVRSEDWKPIHLARSMDPDSPACTFLAKRETFIEEALLTVVVLRRIELLNKWGLPFDQLLELAVTHELGHAFCNERDEGRADHFGEALRQGKPAVCKVSRRESIER